MKTLKVIKKYWYVVMALVAIVIGVFMVSLNKNRADLSVEISNTTTSSYAIAVELAKSHPYVIEHFGKDAEFKLKSEGAMEKDTLQQLVSIEGKQKKGTLAIDAGKFGIDWVVKSLILTDDTSQKSIDLLKP